MSDNIMSNTFPHQQEMVTIDPGVDKPQPYVQGCWNFPARKTGSVLRTVDALSSTGNPNIEDACRTEETAR